MSADRLHVFAQPEATAPDALLDEAIITWGMADGKPAVISRYRDNVWLWPAIGSLTNCTRAARVIDFAPVPPRWRPLVKRALFASLRHPRAGGRAPGFHNLRHKCFHLRRVVEHADALGLARLADMTKAQAETFLRDLTSDVGHMETVLGQIATMAELNGLLRRGLVADGIAFNVAGVRSSQKLAKALWKTVRGQDFVHELEGHQPFPDEDTELIMGVAFHYIRRLAQPLLHAHREVTRIWQENGYLGRGAFNGTGGRRIAREVPAMLARLGFEEDAVTTSHWPPKRGRDVGVHVRLLQGLCTATIAFFTLARRSELLALQAEGCLTPNQRGEWVLHGRIFKGEDDLEGRPASWPVPEIVADAVQVLRDIRAAVSLRAELQLGEALRHGFLLTSTSCVDRGGDDSSAAEMRRQVEPLSGSGIGALSRDLKTFLFPAIEGPCALHRFRKTSVRLVALTVEGSSLVLKNILHHDNQRTTLHYMFASPLMQQELADLWPETAAANLRELYGHRGELVGPGAANLGTLARGGPGTAGARAETDLDVSEEEFVALGVEMMEKGHILLTRLGVGIWCLKPSLERGTCNEGSQDVVPNGGRCSVRCRFHIQDGRRTAANLRDLADIDAALASPDLSRPIRALYERHRNELLTVIPAGAPPA